MSDDGGYTREDALAEHRARETERLRDEADAAAAIAVTEVHQRRGSAPILLAISDYYDLNKKEPDADTAAVWRGLEQLGLQEMLMIIQRAVQRQRDEPVSA